MTLVLAIEHYRGAANLRAWREAMRARGEPLTLAELLPPPPPGRTPVSATTIARLLRLDELLPVAGSGGGDLPYVAPGRVRSVWIEAGAEEAPWDGRTWTAIEAEVAGIAAALGEVRRQLTNRTWTASADYSRGPDTETFNPFSLISVARVLGAATHVDLHARRLDDACDNVLALLALPEDGTAGRLLSGLVGMLAVNRMSVPVTWQALQATGWTDARLAAVQAAWEAKPFLEETALCLAVERAVMGERTFARLRADADLALRSAPIAIVHRSGALPMGGAPPVPGPSGSAWFGTRAVELAVAPAGMVWRMAWLDEDELHYLRTMQEGIDRLRRIAAERSVTAPRKGGDGGGWAVAAFGSVVQSGRGPKAALDRARHCISQVLLPRLQSLVAMACELETLRSMIVAAVALKRHELRHGGLPADLAALVPEFLTAVPVDYQDGKPMRYRARADGTYLLYSVGDDGQDDGGVAEAAVSSGEPPSLTGGRDWVWPVAAAR